MTTLKETAEIVRAKLNKISSFPEVIIPTSLKKEIGELIFRQNNTKTSFNENSFYVETSPKHYAIIPNQYFYLAVECYDLVVKVRCLFDFFDKIFRSNDELKRKINIIQDKISKGEYVNVTSELSNIDYSLFPDITREDFSYLICNLKDSKKFGNLEKNSLRTSEDLLGAYILNIVPLTTAASGYFGTLVYALSSDFAVYKKLCDSIKFSYSKEKDLETPSSFTLNFTQIIYYGVPGSGKSHQIDEATKNLPDEQKMRVVFHPEYTNADFVGQVLPVQTESGLEYPFKAGPFTRILKRALKNPGKPYYLIIEEINRGNAAAIFGDLFQLLDRGLDGWSSYGIENLDINAFIRSENERYSEKTPPTTKQIGNIEYTENTSIRLPPNLSLYATMNTSDQNVFTLDNAFQRRWDMQLVENKFEGEEGKKQENATIIVNNQKISWKDFQTQINAIIGEKSNEGGLSSMEDKRLGCWFVKAENDKIKASVFADKVLKYLWDDAFKFYHQEIFTGDIKNFEELHRRFLEEGFSVFSDVCRLGEKLQPEDTSTDSESSSD